MAEKLGFLSMWLGGDLAERNTINANADALEVVEGQVGRLRATIERQAHEIVQLRATVLGLVELLQRRLQFDDHELEHDVKLAYEQLVPRPKEPRFEGGDPYRGIPPAEPQDSEEAKQLLRRAQDYHFDKQWSHAREVYQDIVDRFGESKQAVVARQQLKNLKGV